MQRHPYDIPVPPQVDRLNKVFKKAGKRLFAVGGHVRDYLMHVLHGVPFKSKDVDLVTDATPSEVAAVLKAADIYCFEKGEAFGVMVANIDGDDYEIATMRADGADGDGRHPDKVTYTTDLALDHERRDLTINGLFYDLDAKEVIDCSTGVEDVRDKRVRTIGNPWRRLGEDRLRILRFVRFHSRLSNESILKADEQTLSALDYYRHLHESVLHHLGQRTLQPISKERVQQEFVAGLKQAVCVKSYLHNLYRLDLMDVIFPGLNHNVQFVDGLSECRDPVVVLAVLFHNMPKGQLVRARLTEAKWPSDIFAPVGFLVETYGSAGLAEPADMVRAALTVRNQPDYRNYLREFVALAPAHQEVLNHLVDYYLPEISGAEVQERYGIEPGPEMGKKIREIQCDHYVADRRRTA